MSRRAKLSQYLGLGDLWILRTNITKKPPKKINHKVIIQQQAITQNAITTNKKPIPELTIEQKKQAKISPDFSNLNWEQIQNEVHNCQYCELHKTRNNAVFGRGAPKARYLIIGEAPGENEDLQSLAFVGRSGQLLDNMLRAINIDSERDVFITNILKCRPPGNRNPSRYEIIACKHFLNAQIAHLKPKLILAFGRFAAQTLLQTEKNITQLRQILHSYNGIPLVVTFHPAYLLRNQTDKTKAWQDMLFALEISRTLK